MKLKLGIFPLARSVDIDPEMSIELNFRGRCDSQVQEFWVWNTTIRKGDQIIVSHKQSSFAGRILTAETLRKASDAWTPRPNLSGKIAERTLSLMGHGISLREIASQVRQEFPQFETIEDAIGQVRKIAEQYGD